MYSFSEAGQPPTPTKTPTSPTFAYSSFETPRQESSFYDPRVTWNTADPYAPSPDFLKTPRLWSFTTPSQSPSAGASRKRPLSATNIEEEIATHVHHVNPDPNASLPPVEASHRLSSSPNLPTSISSATKSDPDSSKQASTPLTSGLDQVTEPNMRSARSMQTPPPTGTSASRRKAHHSQTTKLAPNPAANSRRTSTPTTTKPKMPEVLSSQAEESPLQLSTLQFSPDGFGFSMPGAATAPAYPQHKLFWDPNNEVDGMNMDFPIDDAFTFGTATPKPSDPFPAALAKSTVSQLPPSASFNEFATKGSTADSGLLPHHDSANQVDFIPSSGLMIQTAPKGVDPSLLFSSPSRPPAPTAASQVIQNDTLQPYANQVRDAQRDKEANEERKAKRRRKVQDDSPAVKAALQVLRDGNSICAEAEEPLADSDVDRSRGGPSETDHTGYQTLEGSKRISAAKEGHHVINHRGKTRQSRKRTAVTLTIDENGRAKTETKIIHDNDEPTSELTMEPDSGSGESEAMSSSESEEMVLSQPQSFAFPEQASQNSKLARFATGPNTHSQKSSYASTVASSYAAYSLPAPEVSGRAGMRLEPPSDNRKSSQVNRRLHRALSSTTISDDMDVRDLNHQIDVQSEDETDATSGDGKGNAQSELKKIVRLREQNRTVSASEARKLSLEQHQVYPSLNNQTPIKLHTKVVASGQGRIWNAVEDISPTTVLDGDKSTPGTGRESHVTDTTRCVCQNSEVEGELMILWSVENHVLSKKQC